MKGVIRVRTLPASPASRISGGGEQSGSQTAILKAGLLRGLA